MDLKAALPPPRRSSRLQSAQGPAKAHKSLTRRQKSSPSSDVTGFLAALSASKNIIVLSGAGLSAGSGIATYRGQGGIWNNHSPEHLSTPEAFEENPSRVWLFHYDRYDAAARAEFSLAHLILAQLATSSVRSRFAPDSTFVHITQTGDGLSSRALNSLELPGKSPIYETHGSLLEAKCTLCPWKSSFPPRPLVDNTGVIPDHRLPRCMQCKSQSRPAVVWFGEEPLHHEEIENAVKAADMCLVVGTSLQVRPCASYPAKVKRRGGMVAVFDIEQPVPKRKADLFQPDFLFEGPCEQWLPRVFHGLQAGICDQNED